jgi:hypothetical protein
MSACCMAWSETKEMTLLAGEEKSRSGMKGQEWKNRTRQDSKSVDSSEAGLPR